MALMQRTFRSGLGRPWWFWRRVSERFDFHQNTDALSARMTVAPTSRRQREMDKLVRSLVSAGAWAKMDGFVVFAAHDAQAARLNWVADRYNGTLVDAPVFTANRGYQGDGVNDRIDLGFNATTAVSPKFTQNSAHMGMWSLTNLPNGGTTNSSDFGTTSSFLGRFGTTAGTATLRPNAASTATQASVLPGHVGWNRTASNAFDNYAAGLDVGGGTTASTAITNANFFALSIGGSLWGRNQLACVHWGASMTAAEWLATYRALQRYLQYLGAV